MLRSGFQPCASAPETAITAAETISETMPDNLAITISPR
jgi:hypothetical protein